MAQSDAVAQAATEKGVLDRARIMLIGTLTGPRGLFPIITLRAKALTAQRTALIAEAAHVIPPIGAQGLNTSLNDLSALIETATPETLGTRQHLDAYEKSRARDVAARVAAIGFYNRLTRSGLPQLQDLRLAGLKAVADLPPLRRAVMRAGMGG